MDTKFVVLGLLLLLSAGFAETIFSDGFESGSIDGWDVVQASEHWHVSPGTGYTGNYSIYDETMMSMTFIDLYQYVDLSGYSSVNLSAYAKGGDLGLFICTDNTTALCEPVDSNSLTGDWAYYSAATSNATFLNVNSTIWARLAVGAWGSGYADDFLLIGEAAAAGGEVFNVTGEVGNNLPIFGVINSTSDAGMTDLIEMADSVIEGGTMYFNAPWTDVDSDNITFYVCNSSVFTQGVGCDDTQVCASSSTAVSPAQCTYVADANGDPATNWTAYYFIDDGTGTDNDTLTTFTNHNPTVGGTFDYEGDLLNYANDTLTLNITSLTKADVDDTDTTTFYYRFIDTDGVSVLQDWSTASTYDCTTDGSNTGPGYCSRGDTIYVDARALDSRGAYSDGVEETYIENDTMVILNTIPVIDAVLIDGETAPTVAPTESGSTTVVLTFNVTDYDMMNDVTELTGGVFNGTATDATAMNTTCTWGIVDADTKQAECSIAMLYNVSGGSKTVTVVAGDKASASDSDAASSFTYSSIYIVSLNDSTISFGALTPLTNDNLASESLLMTNAGNGICDYTIQGADLVNGSNSILIGNMSVDDDSTHVGGLSELTLTEAAQDYSPAAGILVDGTSPLFFFLDVPAVPSAAYASEANFEIVTSQKV